ncbi:MAG: cyclic nucleotide-binding domain-containing protein [Gammaproteobacteria bacterium]|nr:cyclic nucleotide-binding domain-containing protein [Gammaproteobacteria bacterium]MDE0443322.1 cyclic nucleotide-binding domain-containing protein [Gammaproteobacteria bacterium]
MLELLRTFKPFQNLGPAALAAIEPHADSLRLPERRWLRRRGQPLTRNLFLVHGTVSVRGASGEQRVSARQTGGESLNELVGDDVEILTVTTVEVIAVDLARVRPILEGQRVAATPEVSVVDEWIHTLLEGPVMRWFPPRTWARLLRAGEARRVRQGDLVVGKGDTPEHIMVVGSGTAASGDTRFGPGDFFAEESALTKLPAANDVVMETDGVVVAFAARDVLELIGEYDAPDVDPPQRLELDRVSTAREEEALASLATGSPVAVRGGDAGRRLVVAARLMREGFTVV